MVREGGNARCSWTLMGMGAMAEATVCSGWDSREGAEGGRRGCMGHMRLVGVKHSVHDHTQLLLQCRTTECGRVVTLSNQSVLRMSFADQVLPADIHQSTFSPRPPRRPAACGRAAD
jgi:hypothetical protein